MRNKVPCDELGMNPVGVRYASEVTRIALDVITIKVNSKAHSVSYHDSLLSTSQLALSRA